jgi:hypothetical protein
VTLQAVFPSFVDFFFFFFKGSPTVEQQKAFPSFSKGWDTSNYKCSSQYFNSAEKSYGNSFLTKTGSAILFPSNSNLFHSILSKNRKDEHRSREFY